MTKRTTQEIDEVKYEIKDKKIKYSQGLWLDTIKRDVLDFDFEKLCCISLQNISIYACLVCGKYFQGI